MWEYATRNPGFFFMIVLLVIMLIRSIWKSRQRTIRIMRHGWPPAHLDADGDFKKEESK